MAYLNNNPLISKHHLDLWLVVTPINITVVAERIKIYNHPSTFFSRRFINFASANPIENKDVIYPKTMGFNRTFMELKLGKPGLSAYEVWLVLIVPLWNWNSLQRERRWAPSCVLIVPLWNWNGSRWCHGVCSTGVLIVPLWNWNRGAASHCLPRACFNRTFMELK